LLDLLFAHHSFFVKTLCSKENSHLHFLTIFFNIFYIYKISPKLKLQAGIFKAMRHAELVSASVDFGISTLSELNGKIQHDTDPETSSG